MPYPMISGNPARRRIEAAGAAFERSKRIEADRSRRAAINCDRLIAVERRIALVNERRIAKRPAGWRTMAKAVMISALDRHDMSLDAAMRKPSVGRRLACLIEIATRLRRDVELSTMTIGILLDRDHTTILHLTKGSGA